MKSEAIVRFLEALGAKKIRVDWEWVRCSCPLASMNHERGRDKHPSFGVKVNEGDTSFAFCFVCGAMQLPRLLHTLQFYQGVWNREASDILTTEEVVGDRPAELTYRDPYMEPVSHVQHVPVPEVVLSKFPVVTELCTQEGKAMQKWLAYVREINLSVAHVRGVLAFPAKQAVVFPIKDRHGRTYALRARSRTRKIFYYVTDYMVQQAWPGIGGEWHLESPRELGLFYGEEAVNFAFPVIVVESELDLLRLVTLGVHNVIACCGVIKQAQLPRLSAFPIVYLGFDADVAGYKSTQKCVEYLSGKTILYNLDWSVAGSGCEDAGKLVNRKELHRVIRARKLI